MGQRWFDGYSADIEIFLLHGGKKFDVAQIGGGSLIMRDPAPIPEGSQVELVIRIDGHEVAEKVVLTGSAEIAEQPVPFF